MGSGVASLLGREASELLYGRRHVPPKPNVIMFLLFVGFA